MTSQKQTCTKRNVPLTRHDRDRRGHTAGNCYQRAFFLFLAAAVLLFIGPARSLAQLSTATAFGNVTDSSGAAIPGATIVLTQTQTNFTRTTTTNALGEYRAEFLPLGPYTVKVNAPGFTQTVRNGIVLTGTQEAALDFALKVGSENTVVTVTERVPLVNTANSVLGRTITNQEVDNLPLVSRDAYQLLNLTPGVQNVQNENSIGLPMEHVIINGSSDNMVGQVTYYLDGGINMTGVRDTGNFIPNPDAIDQFDVQTNNFSAEYRSHRSGCCFSPHQVRNQPGPWIGLRVSPGDELQLGQLSSDDQNAATHQPVRRHGRRPRPEEARSSSLAATVDCGRSTPQTYNTVVPDALQRTGNFSENLPTSTTIAHGLGACATTLSAADKAVRTMAASSSSAIRSRINQSPETAWTWIRTTFPIPSPLPCWPRTFPCPRPTGQRRIIASSATRACRNTTTSS